VDRRVWETMQTKAEEKRKGYCCVVWAERALTRADLDRVEALSREGNAVDEDGEACVEVNGLYFHCGAHQTGYVEVTL
jgi:hypothetical protein